jgi:hypothetical protein
MPTETVHDVRHLDGEPHEVASIAGQQVEATIALALEAIEGLMWAARGAWMTAEEYRTGDMPDGSEFANSPQGVKIIKLDDELRAALSEAKTLSLAASWNPRSYL